MILVYWFVVPNQLKFLAYKKIIYRKAFVFIHFFIVKRTRYDIMLKNIIFYFHLFFKNFTFAHTIIKNDIMTILGKRNIIKSSFLETQIVSRNE